MKTKIFRYINLLKKNKFGLDLPSDAVFNYLKHYFFPRTIELLPSRMAPVVLNLLITMRCNFSCSFCGFASYKKKHGEVTDTTQDMTPKNAVEIMNSEIAKRTLVVLLSGGEPLLNPDIIEIVKEVKLKKKICGMITNGSLLPRHVANLARVRMDDIQLSVYDHYLNTLLKTLPEICREISINASYVLTKSVLKNYPEKIEAVIDLCASSGVRSLKFNICGPYDNDISETIFDDDEIYVSFISRMKKQKIDSMPIFYPNAVSRKVKSRKDKRCRIPWQTVLVDSSNRMTMCCDISNNLAPIYLGGGVGGGNTPFLQKLRSSLLSDDSDIMENCRCCPNRCGSFASRL